MITTTSTETSIIFKKVSRAFGGAVTTILTLLDSGGMLLNGKPVLSQGNFFPLYTSGRAGAGNISVAGLKAGDQVIVAANLTDNLAGEANFTLKIATAGILVQTSATDYSAKTFMLLVARQ